jgi:hypothetical protein
LQNGFLVQPVIVLDTTSANLDLENESDNSEVGAAMAELKQELPGVPLVLVGHTPKAVIKSDLSDITFRGAGAWEADAVATYFLVHDPDTGFRFLAIRKARFSPTYSEINFGHRGGQEVIPTPWGAPQLKTYLHGVPSSTNGEERRAAQEAAREEVKERRREFGLSDRQTKILAEVSSATAAHAPITKTQLRERVGGKRELITQALNRLLETGRLKVVLPPGGAPRKGAGRGAEGFLFPSEVDPDLYQWPDLEKGAEWEPNSPQEGKALPSFSSPSPGN